MTKKQSSSKPTSFEAALSEVEQLVERMESGALSLEESLACYEKGIGLANYCQKSLNEAEQKVKILEAKSTTLRQVSEAAEE